MDKTEEIQGVDGTEKTSGLDDETTEETPGMDDEIPDKKEDKSVEHTSGGLNLCRQSRKVYSRKKCNDNMFNTTNETQDNGIILPKFILDNFEITEDKFDEVDAEYFPDQDSGTKGRFEQRK